eukprot:scaffold40971_cov52-Attheya_sp.AAC.1
MSLEFDAIKMGTQVTLDRMIGSLKLETTDDVGERGVAHREQASDPVSGTEACQMALRFSLDLESSSGGNVWKEFIISTSGSVCCVICEKCAIRDVDGEELAPWYTSRVVGGMDQYFHARIGSGRVERYVHMCGGCMKGQWAIVGPDTNVTVIVSGMKRVKCGTEHILQSLEHSFS